MRSLRLLGLTFGLLTLLGGCATHHYRIHTKGGAASATFYLRQTEARTVVLFASLNGFSPRTAMLAKGCWVNSLPADREFTYFYKVDGEVFIPDCRYKEGDDFGQENCIFLPGR